MENNRTRFSKNFIRNGAIISVILILLIVWAVVAASKKTVMIKCAPYKAAVFIDGKRVDNNASHELASGEHELMAFLDGFAIHTEKIKVDDNTNYIIIGLLPINSIGDELMEKYNDEYYDLETYATTTDEERAQVNYTRGPIHDVLPYTNSTYGLGYINNPDSDPTITITPHSLGFVDNAVDKLKELLAAEKINLARYELKINNFENLLGDFVASNEADPIKFINTGYKNAKMKYEVGTGTTEGDYYYTTIAVVPADKSFKVTYRIVLKKNKDSWSVVAEPYPLLTLPNNPGVPIDILTAANNQASAKIILRNQFDGE